MELSLDHAEGYLLVRRVGSHSVVLLDREMSHSFVLSPEGMVEAWPVEASAVLAASDAQALLAREPELVILGTGERQVFPAAAFMAAFLRQGIGIEVMDNAAAARTYNLLASEGRRVIGAFILPAS